MRFKKTDIQTHSENGYPAVNVKVYHVGCTTEDVVAKFNCTEEQADKALEFAFTAACENFWEYWGDPEYFPGEKVRVYSTGRSGGWLIVQGLAPVEDWDAIMVRKWAKFEHDVKEDVKYRVGKESMLDGIEANEWYLPYSEQYNHVDTAKGTVCLANVKADIVAYSKAKFGFVPEFA